MAERREEWNPKTRELFERFGRALGAGLLGIWAVIRMVRGLPRPDTAPMGLSHMIRFLCLKVRAILPGSLAVGPRPENSHNVGCIESKFFNILQEGRWPSWKLIWRDLASA